MAFTFNDFKAKLNNKASVASTETAATGEGRLQNFAQKAKEVAMKSTTSVRGVLPVTTRRFETEIEEGYKRDVMNTFMVNDLIEQLQAQGINVSADTYESLVARAEAFVEGQEVVEEVKINQTAQPDTGLFKRMALEEIKQEQAAEIAQEEVYEEPSMDEAAEEEEQQEQEELGTTNGRRRRLARKKPIELDEEFAG